MGLGKRGGAVLPLVLGILVAVTCLLTTLLQMPGNVRLVAQRGVQFQQQIYDAESALLAYLEGLPDGHFEREPWNWALPKVSRERRGPWADLSVDVLRSSGPEIDYSKRRVHVLAGIACDSGCAMLRSYSARHEIYEGFGHQLEREIMMVKPPMTLEIKSGNRRLFGRIPSMALKVREGDLELALDGSTSSARFSVEGTVEVRGSAILDTLRIYARGPLLIRGQTKVRWLEAFSEERIEFSQGVEFSGVAVARQEVVFPNGASRVMFRYPSFVMSLESSEIVQRDSMLVPDFVTGALIPFEWKMDEK